MCFRRFTLLSRIEEATVDDIKSFFTRTMRIYFIFSVIDIILLIVGSHSGIIPILQVIFYVLTTIMLYLVVKTTTPSLVLLSMLTFSGVIILNIANIVLLGLSGTAVATVAVSAALALLSILIGSTTLYILFKLRQKMTSITVATAVGEPLSSAPNAGLKENLYSDRA